MMNLAEYRRRSQSLADFLPWAALVAKGVILNKDGSFQRTARFRGPDLDSSTPAELVGAVLAAKQWLTFTSGSPLQPAIAFALDEEPDFPARLAAGLRAKRDLLCAGLERIGLDVRVPEGTYFATTDISALGWEDARSFCLALVTSAGVPSRV